MFSLTETIKRLDREDLLYKQALRCYLAVISAIQECPLETDAVVFRKYKDDLRELQSAVAVTREPEVLEKSLETLSDILKGYPSALVAFLGLAVIPVGELNLPFKFVDSNGILFRLALEHRQNG